MAGGSKKTTSKASASGTAKKKTTKRASKPADSKAAAGADSQPNWGEGVADRRLMSDRRKMLDKNSDSGLERRRGPGRRLSDAVRSAEEGEMTKEQFLFLMAIDAFRRANNTTFPTWSDVMEILRRLGYRKVQESTLNIPAAEDWTERADAPLGAVAKPSETASLNDREDDDEEMEHAA